MQNPKREKKKRKLKLDKMSNIMYFCRVNAFSKQIVGREKRSIYLVSTCFSPLFSWHELKRILVMIFTCSTRPYLEKSHFFCYLLSKNAKRALCTNVNGPKKSFDIFQKNHQLPWPNPVSYFSKLRRKAPVTQFLQKQSLFFNAYH